MPQTSGHTTSRALKGKAKPPHRSSTTKAEDSYSAGGSSPSSTSRSAELFVLGNTPLQSLQRKSTHKAISCLLRVHPVLRGTARTFSYQFKKEKSFYLLSIQESSVFFQEPFKQSKSIKSHTSPIH